jgi:probable addiction module antidote protein
MAVELKSYRSRLMEKLTIPSEAEHYINAALDDSIEMFFEAVRDVAQAHQMALVAKKSGVGREGLYRSLSKQGNPSWKTVLSVLDVVGLEIPGVQAKTTSSHTPISGSSSSYQARKIRFRSQKGAASRRHRSYSGSVSAQLAFVFPIENANVAKAAAAPSAKSSQPSASAGSSPFDWMPSVQQNKESSNLVFNAMLANQQVEAAKHTSGGWV